ncbi:MAG TPA: hypothetical protein DEP45_01955 [Armatimonadetes bacterium]|nr:hypothetical protein [Armatimonadota bacterium]
MSGFNFNIGGFNIGSGSAGGTGAVASKGCGGGCGAIFGVLLGILMIPAGFYLAYHSEVKLVDHGKIFEGITMSQPDAAKAMDGELLKIQGTPEGSFLSIPEYDGEALYARTEVEEYEKEEDSDGDVSYDWNTASTNTVWAQSFKVGGIEIRPEGANPVGEEEVYSAYMKRNSTIYREGVDQSNPDVGDRRKTVDVLDATKPVIVVGQMSGGSIQGGHSFVISTQNEQQTLQTLKTEYKMAKWGMRAGAVFLIFFGIMAIFGPLTTLVGYIPLIGDQIGCAFAGLAFAVALVSVTVTVLFIKAFWILVAIVVLGVAFLIIRGIASPRQRPGEQAPAAAAPTMSVPPAQPTMPLSPETPAVPGVPVAPREAPRLSAPAEPTAEVPRPGAPVEPPAQAFTASDFLRPAQPVEQADEAPKFCSKCGAGLEPESRFCRECGEKIG